jgi:anti-sigma factor ChrR (cupin superfamily)
MTKAAEGVIIVLCFTAPYSPPLLKTPRRPTMATTTIEDLPLEQKRASGRSHIIDAVHMPWQPGPFPGVEVKVLYKDDATGMSTMLVKIAPGGKIPLHEHIDLEQSYVLEGSLEDHDGAVTAGNFCWRDPGSIHVAHAPNGALVLAFFTKPNRFYNDAPHLADYKS